MYNPGERGARHRAKREDGRLNKKEFDPLAYIESSFLDRPKEEHDGNGELNLKLPSMREYISGAKEEEPAPAKGASKRFRKTEMSAPRPRRVKAQRKATKIDPKLQEVWQSLPKNIEFLCSFFDDSITANYYRGNFRESREDLIKRLLDPELSLEETSRLLGVCPATVRRYTNRHWLNHHRTQGGQRRFRLSDIVKFVEAHGRFPQE
jgi:excisionase family DNA binding protein